MNKKSILRQIGRMARTVELIQKDDNRNIRVVHEATKPISGRTAGRILNNQNLRDMLATAAGILIVIDDFLDIDAVGNIKLRKYDKTRKYVISAEIVPENKGIMYAEIKELGSHAFEHAQANGTTMDQ